MESSTERMKQAEHCGFSSKPTLNHTGELNEAYWLTRIALSSASKVSASSSVAKYPPARPQPPIVSTTRPIMCLTEVSRSGEPIRPRKYFCATMFVAVCDQNFGNSTDFWSNTGLSLPGMKASRSSHSTSSNGSRPGIVKKRSTPTEAASFSTTFTTSVSVEMPADAFVDAMCSSQNSCGLDPPRRGTKQGRAAAGRNGFRPICRLFQRIRAARTGAAAIRPERRPPRLRARAAAAGAGR